MQHISVTALNRYAKALLDADPVVSDLWVEGEISSFKRYPSGHCYFTLSDANASVSAVMFANAASRVPFEPKNGDMVLVFCSATVYEKTGAFQLSVTKMRESGDGDRFKHLAALKDRLEKEGLFSQEHKKPIPTYPKRIAVITSLSGAALHDIINVVNRRWRGVTLLLLNAAVQGERCESEVVAALSRLDSLSADVAILARGGGSQEDLYPFNSERIVRAIVSCKTPIISAVGHETDYLLCDFAASLRAPTPSAAAELAVPSADELQAAVNQILSHCGSRANTKLSRASARISVIKSIEQACKGRVSTLTYRVQKALVGAKAHDTSDIQKRGYALAYSRGNPITRAASINRSSPLAVKFFDGQADCSVKDVKLYEQD